MWEGAQSLSKSRFGWTRENSLETTVLEETIRVCYPCFCNRPLTAPSAARLALPAVNSPLSSQTGLVFLFCFVFLNEIRHHYSACKLSNVLPSHTNSFLWSIMPFVAWDLLSFTSFLLTGLTLVILDFLVLECAKVILASVPMNLVFHRTVGLVPPITEVALTQKFSLILLFEAASLYALFPLPALLSFQHIGLSEIVIHISS